MIPTLSSNLFLIFPIQVFVKTAALAASFALHKQDLELPEYYLCGRQDIIEHAFFSPKLCCLKQCDSIELKAHDSRTIG